jgi:hypothetical protein
VLHSSKKGFGSMMWSLLSMPFEVEEIALILQMRPEKIRFLLATGGMTSSYVLREELPTRTKMMTSWDLLGYLVRSKISDFVPKAAAELTSLLLDELARGFDDDSDGYREFQDDEIWSVAEYALENWALTKHMSNGEAFNLLTALERALQESWCSWKAGITNLHESMQAIESQSGWARRSVGVKSIFGLLRTVSYGMQTT